MKSEHIPTTLSTAYSLQGNTLSGSEIIDILEKYFKLSPGEIKMKTRIIEVVKPRQIAIWMLANKNMKENEDERPQWSNIIQNYFPKHDHATMIHSYRTVENMIETNKYYKQQIKEILHLIKCKTITVGEISNKVPVTETK